MSQIKLTKAELAALDLLIASMNEAQGGDPNELAAFIGGVVRVARALVDAVSKATPAVKDVAQKVVEATPVVTAIGDIVDLVGGTSTQGQQESGLDGVAGQAGPGISLEQLIALRKIASASDE